MQGSASSNAKDTGADACTGNRDGIGTHTDSVFSKGKPT